MRPLATSGVFAAVLLAAAGPARAADTGWIERSNVQTDILLKAIGSYNPEYVSSYGMSDFDSGTSNPGPGLIDREDAALKAADETLKANLARETDPKVRQDIEILIKACEFRNEQDDAEHRITLDYVDVGFLIFDSEFQLLQDQIAPERQPAALIKLRKYTGIETGFTPIAKLAEAGFVESLKDPSRVGPYRGKVESQLESLPTYVDGLRKLYAKYNIAGSGPALDALASQMKEYGDWVRREVLPRSRADFRQPPALYALDLKGIGLGITPDELIARARLEFSEVQAELSSLAALVAKERGFPESDYRSVIRELKKEQMPTDELVPYYHQVIAAIEANVRKEHIIALPDRPLIMRLASEAESASQPAPHYLPPQLLNNTGQRGQFVLPLNNPHASRASDDAYDDFSFKAAAWTLTAHEGRPGHDLQFTAMVERGVPLARSIFAWNSVNVEGWALYSESMYKPYEPIDGQLITLQLRLLRAARAILDPMMNLGMISRERAHDVLTGDVVISEAFATEELDRFSFRNPGQATSYFYGFSRIMELRAEAEIALGPKFDLYAFNNFLIGQGLLPPDLLQRAVETEFIPSKR